MIRELFKKTDPCITFRYRKDLEWLDKPEKANKFLPKWFKNLPSVIEGQHKNNMGTAKRCIPVLDACSNGYIIPSWCDLNIQVSSDGILRVNAPTSFGSEHFLTTHSWEQVGDDCPLKNYLTGKAILKLLNPWVIETSRGWSCLFKSPPNAYNNLKFIEGVVDTDTYANRVNLPFFWDGYKEGEFEIKKGSPLVHVIPFKREKLQVKYEPWDEERMQKVNSINNTLFFNRYKRLWWHKRKEKRKEN
jgi:hypothetical protein